MLAAARGRVLHLAAERALTSILAVTARSYVSADLAASGVDVHLELTAVGLRDSSFDLVIALDVLEYVVDDRAALREVHRLLAPDGLAFITVPIPDN